MAGTEIHGGQFIGGEGQGGLAGFQFAIGARLMDKAHGEPEGCGEKIERRANVGDVDDQVAELHQ
ncbi:hypothetical protein D3C75_1375300 [compost metagenome]